MKKKGYGGAVVTGFVIGYAIFYGIYFIIGLFSTDLMWLCVPIWFICIYVSIRYCINIVKKENEKARYQYEMEQEARENAALREKERNAEIYNLRLEFDRCSDVTKRIEKSRYKDLLMEELMKKVQEYENLYFTILAHPETTQYRAICGKQYDPKTALSKISNLLWLNTKFWKGKNEDWKKHNLYAAHLTYSYDGVSAILIQDKYGVSDEEKIKRIKGYNLTEYSKSFDEWNQKQNTEEKLNFDYVFEAMWKFAFTKPCDLDRFGQTVNILNEYLYTLPEDEKSEKGFIECLDVVLAELYVAKEFGEKVLNEKRKIMDKWVDYYISLFTHIGKTLKSTGYYGAGPCVELASGLKWMGLYNLEADVLRKIVTAGLSLSDELQERLRFIENIGNDLKKVYEVNKNADYLALDYATLNWREEDFSKLFQTLVFENKTLGYSLTIREWSKNIIMENRQTLDINEAFAIVQNVIVDEYLSSVKCRKTEIQLLSEDGTESRKTGLLIVPDKSQVGFDYIGLLLNVIGFGRNINLRIYTILMPVGSSLEIQKQQALTLKKNTNPDIVAFENGLQTSILKGMETYMNSDSVTEEISKISVDAEKTGETEQIEEQLF